MTGTLLVVLGVFRWFGREGLLALIAAAIIVCNLQVMKITTLFGVTVTLGNVLYGTVFFCTDLLNEMYGPSAARKGVLIGFVSMLFMTAVMQVALLFGVADDPWAVEVQESMRTIFGFMPRLALASLGAYLLSQFHDVWAFHFWRRKTSGRHLWLRNNLSTIVSQLIDTLVFCTIAFLGVLAREHFMQVMVTTYVMKLVVAAFDTPFMYLGRKLAGAGYGVEGNVSRPHRI
ncbi:queuosine precursor transporter [Candidatus Fermentibacteria bacterium]|nr:queuosine precursor transporter [Candidatus Fermentibacteria bacterium]